MRFWWLKTALFLLLAFGFGPPILLGETQRVSDTTNLIIRPVLASRMICVLPEEQGQDVTIGKISKDGILWKNLGSLSAVTLKIENKVRKLSALNAADKKTRIALQNAKKDKRALLQCSHYSPECKGTTCLPLPVSSSSSFSSSGSAFSSNSSVSSSSSTSSASSSSSVGVFVAVGMGGTRIYSFDGQTWSPNTLGTEPQGDNNYLFRDVAIGGNTIVAVGGGTKVSGATYTTRIATSLDATNWQELTDNSPSFGGVTYGNGFFLAVGSSGRSLKSIDGLTWTNDTRVGTGSWWLRSVAYGNGSFVAVGDSGKRARTTDGVTWTDIMLQGSDLRCVTYGAGKFVAVGGSHIAISSDGQNWSDVTSAYTNLHSVVYGNGKFVMTRGSIVYTSPDAQTWTAHSAPQIYGITFGNGLFVGGGGSGVYYSSDAVTWTRATVPDPSPISRFTYGLITQ